MIKKTPVKTVFSELLCDECQSIMELTFVFDTHPPYFNYECINKSCSLVGAVFTFKKEFPTVEYITEDGKVIGQ